MSEHIRLAILSLLNLAATLGKLCALERHVEQPVADNFVLITAQMAWTKEDAIVENSVCVLFVYTDMCSFFSLSLSVHLKCCP